MVCLHYVYHKHNIDLNDNTCISGSGKTTLLNILSGRCVRTKGAKLIGFITVNDISKRVLGAQKFSQISAYVQQDDVLFNMQTVRETLLNSARLRLPKTMT